VGSPFYAADDANKELALPRARGFTGVRRQRNERGLIVGLSHARVGSPFNGARVRSVMAALPRARGFTYEVKGRAVPNRPLPGSFCLPRPYVIMSSITYTLLKLQIQSVRCQAAFVSHATIE
jgi:hypothetical protein